MHTASPFPPGNPKDASVVINPAVSGTLAALKGAEKYGAKRVVVTSSILAVIKVKPGQEPAVYNEEVFSDPDEGTAYERSKTIAEKAAWDF